MTDDETAGCDICRTSWFRHATIEDQLGVNVEYQTYIYRCIACGTYWQEYGKGIKAISEEWALELLGK